MCSAMATWLPCHACIECHSCMELTHATTRCQLSHLCLQAYLLLGDEEYLHMFSHSYAAAMHWLASPLPPWLGDVDLRTGEHNTQLWVSSLSAFWPGLQVPLPL